MDDGRGAPSSGAGFRRGGKHSIGVLSMGNRKTVAKRTCPELKLFIERELDGNMADAHQTRNEALVEGPRALGAVDSSHRIERVSVSLVGRVSNCLSLWTGSEGRTARVSEYNTNDDAARERERGMEAG